MDTIENKKAKAYKTMDGENLWISISKLRVPDDPKDSSTFDIRKSYWLAYFNALRIKQIKTKNNA